MEWTVIGVFILVQVMFVWQLRRGHIMARLLVSMVQDISLTRHEFKAIGASVRVVDAVNAATNSLSVIGWLFD